MHMQKRSKTSIAIQHRKKTSFYTVRQSQKIPVCSNSTMLQYYSMLSVLLMAEGREQKCNKPDQSATAI